MAIIHRQQHKFLTNIWLSNTGKKKYKPTYGYHTDAITTNLNQHIVIIDRQQQPFLTNIWLSNTGKKKI